MIIHVKELTQPIGHSTSGSHERYKSKERLEWERNNDCNLKMKQWIVDNQISTLDNLQEIENECKEFVKQSKNEAWETYLKPILKIRDEYIRVLETLISKYSDYSIEKFYNQLQRIKEPNKKDILSNARKVLRILFKEKSDEIEVLKIGLMSF